jgi:hypothetical protein
MNGIVNNACTSASSCTFNAPSPGTRTITLALVGIANGTLTDASNPVTISVI